MDMEELCMSAYRYQQVYDSTGRAIEIPSIVRFINLQLPPNRNIVLQHSVIDPQSPIVDSAQPCFGNVTLTNTLRHYAPLKPILLGLIHAALLRNPDG